MRFIITTHARLSGVFLSCPGHWGNLPFADDEAAVTHARSHANGAPISVERETVRRRAIRH